MKKLLLILLFPLITGCATLSKTESFAACQVADAATTVFALGKGGVEANPLMAYVINHWGYLGMFAVKAALIYGVYWALTRNPESELLKGTVAVGTAVTCGVALHNGVVLHSLK